MLLRRSLWSFLVVLAGLGPALPAVDLPPSPSAVPGVKIWPALSWSHWPSVIHPDEERHVVLQVPVRVAGGEVAYRWLGGAGQVPMPVAEGWTRGKEPPGTPRCGALLRLPTTPGMAVAEVGSAQVAVHVVAATAPWPATALVEGRPVDADGRPVVLVDERHDATNARRFAALQRPAARPTGPAVLIGDDLDGALRDLPGISSGCLDSPLAAGAGVVGAARVLHDDMFPASLCWSVGPAALRRPAEEDRVLGAIAHRCQAAGQQPVLVLLLPTLPADVPEAQARREALAQAAAARGWRVLTVDVLAGADATQLAPGVDAVGPVGPARERLRHELVALLQSR